MPTSQHSNLSEVGDVELMLSGDRYPVTAGPLLLASGWRGGQFVTFVSSTTDFVVEKSNGTTACGFIMFQSEKYGPLQPGSFGESPSPVVGSPENWVAHQFLQGRGGQNVATMLSGNFRAFFKVFETTALAGGTRSGGLITYALNQNLKVSENGLLCNDSDAQLALVGIPTPVVIGIVSAVPSTRNGNRLCMDGK